MPLSGHWTFDGYYFNVVIAGLTVHDSRYILVSVHDVTELVALKRQRRRIGSQLLRAQEDERRRIARELHDSTSQMLVALQFDLARLGGQAGFKAKAIVAECKRAVQDIQREIRAFSFLAHPPALETSNLGVALQDLGRGFAARTDLKIDVEVAYDGEVSDSIQTAIYRLCQEALSNVYRHARAKHASIRLVGRKNYLHLLIVDDGIGFDLDDNAKLHALGVGVTGMSERVRELGGRLSIRRARRGTAMTVSFQREERVMFAPPIGGV